MNGRTHELRIYASQRHKTAQSGDLILHLWFNGKHSMQLDLDIALNRPDVSYVDVVDYASHTTERRWSGW